MARRRIRSQKERSARTQQPVVGTLRVIGGRMRGRPIRYLGDPRTRPMKQRVREAAFNLLGRQVTGTHVVDLFAGTGALAWEALSSGAASPTLIERHFPSARLVRENATALGVSDQVEVVAGDTFFWARKLDPGNVAPEQDRPWLVFVSPPYELYVSELDAMLELINRMLDFAPADSLFVVESDRRFDATELPDSVIWDVREYPPAVLALGQVKRREKGDSVG